MIKTEERVCQDFLGITMDNVPNQLHFGLAQLSTSTGEGIGYALQYSWAFLGAQHVKTPPPMQEAWVQSLAWEDTVEKGKATHSSILAWRRLWTV